MKKKIFISLLLFITLILLLKPVFSQNAGEYFNKGNSMLVSGNLEKSVQFYNQAIKQNKGYSEAYLGLGMAYKELGKYKEAYEATLKAIQLNPKYYQAYYNLGLILEKQDKTGEAIQAYEKFAKEVPGSERFSDVKQRISKLKSKEQ